MKSLKFLVALALVVVVGHFFYQANYEVPVLMYHRVGHSEKANMNVSLAAFERQMEFLKIHGYHVIPLEELFRLFKSKQPVPPKTVVITFDDGFDDNFENAFPVLRRLNLPATVFMITDNIGQPGWLDEEDLKILDSSEVAIGSHTKSHMHLPDHTAEDIEHDIVGSKKRLESILGHPVTLFSYPGGGFTEEAKKIVEDAGFSGAVTTNWGTAKADPYSVRRIKITDRAGNLFNFWIKLSGLYHLGKKRIPVPAY